MANCSSCNDKGFVPSKTLGKFSGKPIPGCVTFCSCHPYFAENEHPSIPLATEGGRPGIGSRSQKQQRGRLHLYLDDFNFPCSYAFRSYYEEQFTGRPLEPLKVDEAADDMAHSEPQWERRQWQSVQQLRAMVNFLSNKVTEMRIEKKKEETDHY